MINVTLHYIDEDGHEVEIPSALPAIPNVGHTFIFQDKDRDVSINGSVHDVQWVETDGDLEVKIILDGYVRTKFNARLS